MVAWALEVPVLPVVELRAVLLREVQALPPQTLVVLLQAVLVLPGALQEQVLLVLWAVEFVVAAPAQLLPVRMYSPGSLLLAAVLVRPLSPDTTPASMPGTT